MHQGLNKGINLIPTGCLLSYRAACWIDCLRKIMYFPFSNCILSSSKRSALTSVVLEPQLKGFKTFLYCSAYYTKFLRVYLAFRSARLSMQRVGLLNPLLTKHPDIYLASMWNFGHSAGGQNGCFRNTSLQVDQLLYMTIKVIDLWSMSLRQKLVQGYSSCPSKKSLVIMACNSYFKDSDLL